MAAKSSYETEKTEEAAKPAPKAPEPAKTYKATKEFIAPGGAHWGKGASGLSFDAADAEELLKKGVIEEEKPEEPKK